MRWLTRTLAALALLAVLLWGGAVGYLWLNESRLVFRSGFSHRPGAPIGAPFQPLQLAAPDGIRLDGVTLTAGDADPTRYWIIYFHGNAGSLRRPRVQQQLQTLHELGYDVLSFDYRGYGRSEGAPSEAGLYGDAHAAYDYLRRHGVDSSRIILAGQSLGSAVAVDLATRVASAGVALFSPIDSVPLAAGRIYPWVPANYLATNRFDALAKAPLLRRPVIVFHSATDRLIPLAAARTLYDAITAPKRMLETAGGHNNAGFAEPDTLRQAFWGFWPVAAIAGEYVAAAD